MSNSKKEIYTDNESVYYGDITVASREWLRLMLENVTTQSDVDALLADLPALEKVQNRTVYMRHIGHRKTEFVGWLMDLPEWAMNAACDNDCVISLLHNMESVDIGRQCFQGSKTYVPCELV